MRKKKKINESRKKYGGFDEHQQISKTLKPALSQIPVKPVIWDRDILPEHLWMAALYQVYGPNTPGIFHAFMDAIDESLPNDLQQPAVGLISDFGRVDEKVRQAFLVKNRRLVIEAFNKPFGRMLRYYPQSPASWLLLKDESDGKKVLSFDTDIAELIKLTLSLLPAKDNFAGPVRALPFARMAKHGKVNVPGEYIDLLCKYPDCSEDERQRVESLARSMMNMVIQHGGHYNLDWSKYFWRQNQNLVPCRIEVKSQEGSHIEAEAFDNWQAGLINAVSDYIKRLSQQFAYDLYTPERDEVLLGLFTRIARLLLFMCSDGNLQTKDLGGITLRCIVDSAITFCYLVKHGSEEEFQAFIDYGRGKEKLLMMHLQDNYEDATSLDGETADDLAEGLGGGFFTELTEVNLANWTQKSARDLANLSGLERWYRLVYDPTSAEVHGMWHSLKSSNMIHCLQPLHRYHRVPFLHEPVAIANYVIAAQAVYEHCLGVGVSNARFPECLQSPSKLRELVSAPSESDG